MCIRKQECHAYMTKKYLTGLINQELPCSITQSESNLAHDTRQNINRGTHTGIRNWLYTIDFWSLKVQVTQTKFNTIAGIKHYSNNWMYQTLK